MTNPSPNGFNPIASFVADKVSAMLAYWDINLVCRFANSAYLEWFGMGKEDMINQITLKELLGEELFELNKPYIYGALKGKEQQFEREIPLKNGEVRYTLANYYPHIENGIVQGFIVHGADVTKMKLLENELIKSNRTITEQRNRLLNFSHIASHNLRSPVANLGTLLGFDRSSSDEVDKEMLMDKFGIVIDNLTETLDVVTETLKINLNAEQERELCNMEEAFNKTLGLFSGQILETKATIVHDFSNAPTILYYKPYLESIFLNLLSNSIRYRSSDRSLEINFKASIENNRTILSATDNGLGIDLNKYGDAMFKLKGSFHRHPDSKGIGLFITKSQIESMGGQITAESQVGNGATFKVVF